MNHFYKAFLVIYFFSCYCYFEATASRIADYKILKEELLKKESNKFLGQKLHLSEDEEKVNELLFKMKTSLYGDNNFFLNKHFMEMKQKIENLELFDLIKRIPKGSALHIHDSAIVDMKWMVSNVTYRPNLYFCVTNDIAQFNFSIPAPTDNENCKWKLVSEERKAVGAPLFDQLLLNNLTFTLPQLSKCKGNYAKTWETFESKFMAASGLYQNVDVFYDYWMKAFEMWYEDNVQYLEIRSLILTLYSTKGEVYNMTYFMKLFEKAKADFAKTHPDFIPARFIMSMPRKISAQAVEDSLMQTLTLQNQFPDTVFGFDLVGPENFGHPLYDFSRQFLRHGKNISYFFHAGETNWFDTATDKNLLDAVLLNTTRIGHGYAILKHPEVLQIVKKRRIALEVCPISNQVLGLVGDLRNHPATTLISASVPMVISSDDPPVWHAHGLSHDFFVAFTILGGENSDLRLLKQLALNSIEFSGLPDSHKKTLKYLWQIKWNTFINTTIKKYSL